LKPSDRTRESQFVSSVPRDPERSTGWMRALNADFDGPAEALPAALSGPIHSRGVETLSG
jgi:hypothetical protein